MGANPETKVQNLLRQHRFRLVRQTKHLVYVNPENRVWVCASTPSDVRAAHNQLTSLKRCLAAPPVPMVLAISEYERDEAAAKIAGQAKAVQGIGGGGARGRGCGIYYEDAKVLTVEQIAHREQLRQRARANKEARRAAKLARIAEQAALTQQRQADWARKEAERRAAEEKRLEPLRPFIDLLRHSTAKFHELSIARWRHYPRAWDAQSNYFEYPFRNLEELRFALDYKDLRGRSLERMDEVVTLSHDASSKFQPPSLKKLLETVEELVVKYDGSLCDVADQLSDIAAKLENDDSLDGLRALFLQEVHELLLTLLELLENCLTNFAQDVNVVEPDSEDFVIVANGNRFVVVNVDDEERIDALDFPPQNMLDKHIAQALLVKTVGVNKEINVYNGGFPITAIPEYEAAMADDEEKTEAA